MAVLKRPELPLDESPKKGEDLELNDGTVESGDGPLLPERSERPLIEEVDTSLEIAELRSRLELEHARPIDALSEFIGMVGVTGTDGASVEKIRRSVHPDLVRQMEEIAELERKKEDLLREVAALAVVEDRVMDTIEKFSDWISRWTGEHAHRVTITVMRLAEEFANFRHKVMNDLKEGGRSHDIGKVAVGKKILNKNGPPDEWERYIINSHPDVGAKLVRLINPDWADIAEDHHEKFEGGGYPNNRKGYEIAFTAQMLLITDIFDAVSADRPYRSGLLPAEAMRKIMSKVAKFGEANPILYNQFKAMHRSRQITSARYFNSKPDLDRLQANLDASNPYSVEHIEQEITNDKLMIRRMVLNGSSSRPESVDSDHLVESIGHVNPRSVQGVSDRLSSEVRQLEERVRASHDMSVRIVQLFVSSVEARNLSYEQPSEEVKQGNAPDGEPWTKEKIQKKIKGDIEARLKDVSKINTNRERVTLMLVQDMGLSEGDQRDAVLGAFLLPVGTASVPESTIASHEVLSSGEMERSIKLVPEFGYKLMQGLVTPEVEPYINLGGAMNVLAEAYMHADGIGGYGYGRRPKELPLKVQATGLAAKYTSLRSKTSWREALGAREAYELLSKNAKTEFDERVWQSFTKLYVLDQIGYIDHPEMADVVRKSMTERVPKILEENQDQVVLGEIAKRFVSAGLDREKVQLCLEGAAYARSRGLTEQMERFIYLAESLILATKDTHSLEEFAKLYQYDLAELAENRIEEIDELVATGSFEEIKRTRDVLVKLLANFGERGEEPSPELVQRLKEHIIPAYLEISQRILIEYKESLIGSDPEAIKKLRKQLKIAERDLGDAEFSGQVAATEKEAGRRLAELNIDKSLNLLEEMFEDGRLDDPWNARHRLATAYRVLRENKDLPEDEREALTYKIRQAELAMKRGGYGAVLDAIKRNADKGNVEMVQSLIKEMSWWTDGLDGVADANESVLEDLRRRALILGVWETVKLLQRDDLGAEDIPLIRDWQADIIAWQQELDLANAGADDGVLLTPAALAAKVRSAYVNIRQNLNSEFEEKLALAKDGDPESENHLKRLIGIITEYVQDIHDNPDDIKDGFKWGFPQDLVDDEILGYKMQAQERLYEIFIGNMSGLMGVGKENDLADRIMYFKQYAGLLPKTSSVNGFELSQEQIAVLDQIEIDAYSASLNQRIEYLAKTSNVELPRLIAEIRDLRIIWMRLREKVHEDLAIHDYERRLNEALERSFANVFYKASAAKNESLLIDSVLSLHGVAEEGLAGTGFAIDLKEWRNSDAMIDDMADHLRRLAHDLAHEGELDKYRDAKAALVFLERPNEDEKEDDHLALREFAKRSFMRIRLYAAQSLVAEMRAEQDRLEAAVEEWPDVIAATWLDQIREFADTEAERAVLAYAMTKVSYKQFGSLLSSRVDVFEETIKELAVQLVETDSGKKDASRLEKLLAS